MSMTKRVQARRNAALMKPMAVALLLAFAGPVGAAGLTNVGLFPGGGYNYAAAVSSDGSTVVGYADDGTGNGVAYRWTSSGGLSSLGTLGGIFSQASDVSADGSAITGNSYYAVGSSNTHAFRWDSTHGMTDLGTLGGSNSWGFGISGDGSVVAGYSNIAGNTTYHAFRWDQASGMTDLGTLGGLSSVGYSVSGNGLVIVGYSQITGSTLNHAFSWTQAGGMTDLGTLGGANSYAYRTSYDGSVIVGDSNISGSSVYHAFRWTGGVMADLGVLPGDSDSTALGVSGDGLVVVGVSSQGNIATQNAFRWTQATGMQTVAQWLSNGGVSTTGWNLKQATGVNSDGSIVVGYGVYGSATQGFVAQVANPGGGTPPGGPSPSGLVGLTSLAQSLWVTKSLPSQTDQIVSLSLNGAHHRTLMDMPMAGGDSCGWVSGDLGRVNRDGSGYLGIAEAGVCHDFTGNVRAGVGIGTGRTGIDLNDGGHGHFSGQYAVGEADWAITQGKQPLVFSLLGYYGRWNADLKRGYNTSGAQPSEGSTTVQDTALRLRLDWTDAFAAGNVRFTPRLAYTLRRTGVNAYTETGGSAPASYADHTHNSRELRAGLTGRYDVSDATQVRGMVEAVHRFDRDDQVTVTSSIFSTITYPVSFSSSQTRQNWVRVGAEMDRKLSDKSLLSISANVSSAGQDADVTAGVSYKVLF